MFEPIGFYFNIDNVLCFLACDSERVPLDVPFNLILDASEVIRNGHPLITFIEVVLPIHRAF